MAKELPCHPDLILENWHTIHNLVNTLAHESRGRKGKLNRENMLIAAEIIGQSLKPPISGEEVLSWTMGTMRLNRGNGKPKNASNIHVAEISGRKLEFSVKSTMTKAKTVRSASPIIPPIPKGFVRSESQLTGYPEPERVDMSTIHKTPAVQPTVKATRPHAIKVNGANDPFNKESRTLYNWMCSELGSLGIGETVALPTASWEEANKIRELLHGVSRRLNWIPIPPEAPDTFWKSYLTTIKDDKVYVHRLG